MPSSRHPFLPQRVGRAAPLTPKVGTCVQLPFQHAGRDLLPFQ